MPRWGFSPKTGPPKLKLFNLLSWTHEIFNVSQKEGKTKFGGCKLRAPPNGPAKIQTF